MLCSSFHPNIQAASVGTGCFLPHSSFALICLTRNQPFLEEVTGLVLQVQNCPIRANFQSQLRDCMHHGGSDPCKFTCRSLPLTYGAIQGWTHKKFLFAHLAKEILFSQFQHCKYMNCRDVP